ncbi:MAG TPA: hypothetical protein VEC11_12415 [Allosphingosinicella sp.]|nr:hypothetical protein [Allosphingosinicella sp.]
MKKLPIAAAALLFGTSAYAMVPSTEPTGVVVDKDPYTVMGTQAGTTALSASDGAFKLQPAAADWWDKAEPVAYVADDAALKDAELTDKADVALASSDDFATTDEEWDAIAAQKAVEEGEPALDSAIVEPDPVASETSALDEEPVPVENGVGGPYQGVETAATDVTPRAASQNYPACRPGPGDDRCIQLYEPGVREELASWNQPTGGFADTQMAAADSTSETERLNQLALADSTNALQNVQMAAAGPIETADEAALETAEAQAQDAALIQQASFEDEATADMAVDEDLADEEPVEV